MVFIIVFSRIACTVYMFWVVIVFLWIACMVYMFGVVIVFLRIACTVDMFRVIMVFTIAFFCVVDARFGFWFIAIYYWNVKRGVNGFFDVCCKNGCVFFGEMVFIIR